MRTIKSLIAVFALVVASAVMAVAQTSLASLDSSRVDVQGQRGKVVVLALGASWLPLSGKQAEYTNILAQRYTGKDGVVYFVCTDSTTDQSHNYATNAHIQNF